MATQETQVLDSIVAGTRRKMLTLGGAALAGLAFGPTKAANAASITDGDILNFALNLEYLEANFYTLATQGKTIDQIGLGIGAGTTTTAATGMGTVITKPGGPTACKVPWTIPIVQAYAQETALEEQKHVTFLRNALNALTTPYAVAEPNLDLYNSFQVLGGLVGVTNFDPFLNDVYFLIGAYIFEDVGVTAYAGASGSITTPAYLSAAAGILAVEAYHAGLVRTTIFQLDSMNGNTNFSNLTQAISKVRSTAAADPANPTDDIGISIVPTTLNGTVTGQSGVTVADVNLANSLAYTRTPTQVLQIVTGGTSAGNYKGLFFPQGLNGVIQ